MILAASFVLTTSRFVGLFSTELIYSCLWWPLECSKSHSFCFSVQFCNGKVFVVNVRSNDFICEHLRSNTSILQRGKTSISNLIERMKETDLLWDQNFIFWFTASNERRTKITHLMNIAPRKNWKLYIISCVIVFILRIQSIRLGL